MLFRSASITRVPAYLRRILASSSAPLYAYRRQAHGREAVLASISQKVLLKPTVASCASNRTQARNREPRSPSTCHLISNIPCRRRQTWEIPVYLDRYLPGHSICLKNWRNWRCHAQRSRLYLLLCKEAYQ